MLLLYAVAAGLLIGLATGGNVASLSTVRIRLWQVALAGLAFQVVLFSSPLSASVGDLGPYLYVASTTVVFVALALNVHLPGFWVITIGALANLAVVVANGGYMPASPDALIAVTGAPFPPPMDFSNSIVAGPNTRLYFLADIFALPRPFPFANVFSIGDVLIGLGGAWFIVRVLHRPLRPLRASHG